ncbi:hypothetical protein AVEN_23491-1 [Araneus ventricosus]|uniref:Uncharacterized protein n=1 Tax=Araneus ventricosus TaxID=182803 RepID=A0A4Y2N7X9_ARAVE|nr:hypothetical protein AVEN_23491-1 [Araneus ventricosus]
MNDCSTKEMNDIFISFDSYSSNLMSNEIHPQPFKDELIASDFSESRRLNFAGGVSVHVAAIAVKIPQGIHEYLDVQADVVFRKPDVIDKDILPSLKRKGQDELEFCDQNRKKVM